MSSIDEPINNKEKVVPFGARKKEIVETKPQPQKTTKTIDWSSSIQADQAETRAIFLVEMHTDAILELMANYFKEQGLFDPSKLNEYQYKDMVLIKEAITSMFARRIGMNHSLHQFIDNEMSIPLPDDENN